ncbi:hypothetical protein CUMW_272560 [Citrus unshiu]|uniref:Uncharacterized protein n=1 Tax=Citrus unshiu TaxID=55188 RepID=A0A2H5MV49_CITUN|nr:hypothetical protein CUMW_272560 [Citrus unshiu]
MHLNFGSITLPAPPNNYCSSPKNLIFISALHPSSGTPDILGRLPNLQTLKSVWRFELLSFWGFQKPMRTPQTGMLEAGE